jgi:hypothetical protein
LVQGRAEEALRVSENIPLPEPAHAFQEALNLRQGRINEALRWAQEALDFVYAPLGCYFLWLNFSVKESIDD